MALVPGTRAAVLDRCVNSGDFAITYDEGPGSFIAPILSMLASKDTKATFHIVTQYINDPVVAANIQAIAKGGHVIGLRLTPNVDYKDTNAVLNDFTASTTKLREVLGGASPRYVRLPYVAPNDPNIEAFRATVAALEAKGYIVTHQNIDIGIYNVGATAASVLAPVQTQLSGIASSVKGSFIVAASDNVAISAAGTQGIIDYVKGLGYNVVTIDKCAGRADGLTSTNGGDGTFDPSRKPTTTAGAPNIPAPTTSDADSGKGYTTAAIIGSALLGILYQLF